MCFVVVKSIQAVKQFKFFYKKIKRYCCFCQFTDQYSFHSFHEIRKDKTRLQALYYKVLDDIEVLKLYKDVNQIVIDFDIFDPYYYTSNLNQGEKSNQLKDFLFYSQMNKKLLILLILLTKSETFFIRLNSFVCGYCVGYYFYDLLRPKHPAEEILQFFSNYNRKHGFVDSNIRKIKYKP